MDGVAVVSNDETDVPKSVYIWHTRNMPSGRIIIGGRAGT